MRALITGGKGFVGQWLAAHLKDRGDEVAVIDIETDVADGAAVARVMADVVPEAVYHLAAMTHVGESWEHPGQVLRVNVLGTAEILAAARSIEGSPRVLVVSSAEVYGVVTPAQLPLDEDTGAAPDRTGGRQDLRRAEHVDAQDLAGVLPALPHVRHGGEVVDRLGHDVGHDPAHRGAIGHVRFDVDHRHLIAPVFEVRSQPMAHEALAAGDQRTHARNPTARPPGRPHRPAGAARRSPPTSARPQR